MIVTLVLLILLVVFLAVFIGMNLSNVCQTFWFFKTYENVPSIILVFISFAAGIIVALLICLIIKLRSPSDREKVKEGVQTELSKLEKKNKKLKEKKAGLFSKKDKSAASNTETSVSAENKSETGVTD